MSVPIVEICVDTLEGARAAARGGADRLELCAALSEHGLTPSLGLVQQAVQTLPVPIHVMVRPRSGGFVYSADELAAMEVDIEAFKRAGVQGIVLGVLTSENRVDVAQTRRLVALAAPLPVTFHRAFDDCPDLPQALEDVIASGARMILTSGGAPTLVRGAGAVADLVRRAAGRIEIIASSGVTIDTAKDLWQATHAPAMHASLRRRVRTNIRPAEIPGSEGRPGAAAAGPLEEDVRALVHCFQR
jgi:copper homeostasis protein